MSTTVNIPRSVLVGYVRNKLTLGTSIHTYSLCKTTFHQCSLCFHYYPQHVRKFQLVTRHHILGLRGSPGLAGGLALFKAQSRVQDVETFKQG